MLHLAHGYIKVNGYVIQRCCLCGTLLVKLDYKQHVNIPKDLAVYDPGTWVWIEQNEEGVPDHQVVDPCISGMKSLSPGVQLQPGLDIHTFLCTEV